jgi:hypothetical protein
MQAEELYSKFYPINEKITNNEFGHKLYWGIVAKRKVVPVNRAFFGLEVAKEKVRRGLKGIQIIESHTTIVDKDVVVKLEKVIVGSLSMHKPKKTPHGLTVATNHGRRPFGFTKKEVFRIKELQKLKKVELVALKSSMANVLQHKSNFEAKLKHLCFQWRTKRQPMLKLRWRWRLQWASFQPRKHR